LAYEITTNAVLGETLSELWTGSITYVYQTLLRDVDRPKNKSIYILDNCESSYSEERLMHRSTTFQLTKEINGDWRLISIAIKVKE